MAYRRTEREQARLDGVRDRIVAAAVDLVGSGGWTAVSIAAVAGHAGVATGTVYRHVANKHDLCAEAFRRAAGRELEVVVAALSDGEDPRARVDSGLHAFASRALAAPLMAHALLVEPGGPAVEEERLRHHAAHREAFARVLQDGIRTGAFAPHDTEVVAAVLVGAMAEVLVGPLSVVDGRDTTPQVDALVDACLRALPGPA